MGLITSLFTYKKAMGMRLRGMLLSIQLRTMGCKVGPGLRAEGWPQFRLYPSGNFEIGRRLTLGRDVTFEIARGATLQIGDGVFLSDRVVLSTLTHIQIGDRVSIAENTGVRGAFHQLRATALAVDQASDSAPIHIEKGVGIGAGTVILMGVHLPEGAIVGANAVLHGKMRYEANGIYAGAPAKLLRMRQ